MDSTPDTSAPRNLALDKIALAALRQADRICFVFDADGASYIRAVKENKPDARNPFAAREAIYTVPCEFHITDYGRQTPGHGVRNADAAREGYSCFEMIYGGTYAAEWNTITAILKPGDILTLDWSRDAARLPAEKPEYFVDRLRLVAQRDDKAMVFLIGDSYSSGPDFEIARMVKRSTVA